MGKELVREDLIKIDDCVYEIPKTYRSDMRVPARVFVHENMLDYLVKDHSLYQLANVATLPGIARCAFAMPDIHQGYGFPIGGVAGMVIQDGGVISPGGIGYDINCGVRLLRATITASDIRTHLEKLATDLFNNVPSGVAKGGSMELSAKDLDSILNYGAKHMFNLDYATQQDLEFCQERGYMQGATADTVSYQAKKRGFDQLGTLGSGNHFLEIQMIDTIYDKQIADIFGLHVGFVTVMIHCGSRGLGHQVCTDYIRTMMTEVEKYDIVLPDRQLVCAPFQTPIAQDYFSAMQAAANFAWANRQMISHLVRQVWRKILGKDAQLNLVYDVSHNIGQVENHTINGNTKAVIVHRKGATRAFGPGRPEIPALYRHSGQPVLIPGTMGTCSYVLSGTQESMDLAFGSCCHGAGRIMSRAQAKNDVAGSTLRKQLEKQGIIIRTNSNQGLAEEAPCAYKDVDAVVDIVHKVKLAKRVAKLVPLAVIKG